MDYKNTIENTSALIGALVLAKKGKYDLAKRFLAKLDKKAIDDLVSSLSEVVKVMSEGSDLEELDNTEDDDEDEEEDEEEDDDDDEEIMQDYDDKDDTEDDEDDVDSIIDDMEETGELDKSVASILKGMNY